MRPRVHEDLAAHAALRALAIDGERPESRAGSEILVDSGSHCSVFPRWFAEGGQRVAESPSALQLRSATGKLLKTYEVWLVPVRLRARSGEVLDGCIRSAAADVRGPLPVGCVS